MIHQSQCLNFQIIKIKIISSYDSISINDRKTRIIDYIRKKKKKRRGRKRNNIIFYCINILYSNIRRFECLLNSLLLLISFNKSPRLIIPIIRFYPRVKRCRNLPIHRTRRIRLTRPENAFRIRVLAERSIVVLRH